MDVCECTRAHVHDKCNVCMGILDDLGSLGLICINLRFMHRFLRFHSILALLSLIAYLSMSS